MDNLERLSLLAKPHELRSCKIQVPSLNHVLAIQTTIRPQKETLTATLESLSKAGLGEWRGQKIIAADGYNPATEGWEMVSSLEQKGSAQTFFMLLDKIVELWPKTEKVTFCEDDIVLSKNALDYIQQTILDRDLSLIAWFSPYWPRSDRVPEQKPVLGCFYNKDFFYSQCVTISRSLLNQIRTMQSTWKEKDGPDLLMKRRGFKCAVHYPNLAEHVGGENSACGHSDWGPRRSISFVGKDFDALNLIDSAHKS